MPAIVAKSLLALAVLGSIAAVAFQRPPNAGEEGAMFVDVVAEQATVAVQPDNPDEDRYSPGMAESAFADAAIAPLPAHAATSR
jgi:hypothetical protein